MGDPPGRGAAFFRAVLRVAGVLCLLLAALLLGADASEYPGLTRAGVRALARGALPLLVVGVVAVRAVESGRGWRLAAAGGGLLMLGEALRVLPGGAPPLFWMLAGAAALLLVGSVGVLVTRESLQPVRVAGGSDTQRGGPPG